MGINISHVISLAFYCLAMIPGTISRERRGFSPYREVLNHLLIFDTKQMKR